MESRLPTYSAKLFDPYRYKVLAGGRGSSKSHTVARILLIRGTHEKRRVLCAREFQSSIAESVHKLFSDLIDELDLNYHYTVTQNRIYGKNGTELIFKGLALNLQSIKSTEGVTDLWLEEAQTVSKESWDVLIPTIRTPNSEIWVTYNPENEDDPTHTRFFDERGNPRVSANALIMKVNWRDSPWFPDVLAVEKDYLFEVDPDLAMHVWEGECRSHSDKQIFKGKWVVEDFEVDPAWHGPYLGADWGFSVDPTVLVKVYIDIDERRLMIREEAHGYHVELDDLPELFDNIDEARDYKIIADNARPETISYLSRKRFDIVGTTKWKGSVEDGIEFIRTFRKIVIHPDCPNMKFEAKNYSYKVDKLTDKVTTKVVDLHNHNWDAVRYALNDLITAEGMGILGVL